MKKFGILVLSSLLVLFSFSACKHGVNNSQEYGKLSLSIAPQDRTIAPVDWKFSNLNSMYVTFTDKVTNEKLNEFAYANIENKYNLPVGEYIIELNTLYDSSYEIYGKSECTITAGTTTENCVYVSLKKTEAGTGRFEYEIVITDKNFIALISDYKFEGSLTPVNGGDPVELLLEISTDFNGNPVLDFTNTSVKSGYYYLTIYYSKLKNNSDYYEKIVLPILGDTLVEIADNQSSSRSVGDYDFKQATTRNYYITNSETQTSGLLPESPANIDSVFELLKASSDWQTANLYFSKATEEDEGTLDWFNDVTPKITVEKLPDTADTNKAVNIYIGWDIAYKIENGQINILCNKAENNPVYFLSSADDLTSVAVNAAGLHNEVAPVICVDNIALTLNNAPKINSIDLYGMNVETEYDSETSLPVLQVLNTSFAPAVTVKIYDGSNFDKNYVLLSRTEGFSSVSSYYYVASTEQQGMTVKLAVPSFSVEDISSHSGNYEMEEGDKAKFTIKITEDALLNIGSKVTWTYNDHIITGPFTVSEDNTDDWKTVEVDVYNSLYTWDGYNYVTAIIEYNGIKVSKNNSFLVERNPGQGIIYFNFIDNYSAEPNPGWRSTIKDINGNFIQAPFSQSRYAEEELYAYCYDDFFNLYVAVKTEKWSNYYSFYKYEYSKAKLGYKPERKLLGIVNSEYKLPLRITVRPTKSEMFILTKGSSNYFDNVLYKLDISEVLNEDEINEENIASVSKSWADIAVRVQSDGKNNDFDSITAIAYNSNTDHYYIAGEKKTPIFLEDGDLHFKNDSGEDDDPADGYSNYTYSVKEYKYSYSAMEPVAGGYSYSYTDFDILASAAEPDSPYAKLITPSSMPEENQYTLYLTKLHCPITDISFLNGNMAMLRIFTSYSQYRTATVEGGETSWGYNNYDNGKYCFSVVYKPENEAQRIIDLPEQVDYKPIYPVRILAIKKDELVFADGDVDYQGYGITHTINLNNNSISSSMHYSDYYYGYKFDNVTGGSDGSYDWSYHAVKVISVDGE